MKKRKVRVFLSILVCLFVVPICSAVVDEQVKFKMTCPNTELLLSEIATVTVWAWVDSAYGTVGNGLDTWQLDLDVDTTGVVGITGVSLIAPDPDPAWSGYFSINTPMTGEASSVAVNQVTIGASSETGIGGYSEIFSFEIEAIAEGVVTYTIDGDEAGWFAYLSNGDWFENSAGADGGVYFDAAVSDNVFTVVPEPCSLMIMSGLSVLALGRRRRLG